MPSVSMRSTIEAEILNGCCESATNLDEAMSRGLCLEHFECKKNSNAWLCLNNFWDRGTIPTHSLLIAEACEQKIELPQITPNPQVSVARFVELLFQFNIRSYLIGGMAEITAKLRSQEINPEDAQIRTESLFGNVECYGKSRLADLRESSLLFLSSAQQRGNGQIKTGFQHLDTLIGGWCPGQLYILAGRPGSGKTSLALNFLNCLQSPIFFSLEMTSAELIYRLLSIRLRRHEVNYYKEWCSIHSLEKDVEELQKFPMFLNDDPTQTVASIGFDCRRLKAKRSLGAIVVDYLQIVKPSDPRLPREQQIAEISYGLKSLAKRLEIPVICLCQINRSAEQENRRPRLCDLRESGAIEQNADVVMFIDRREELHNGRNGPDAGARDLVIAKNRHGPTGIVQLQFDSRCQTFEE
jgi:replicative DNA helicase